MSKKTKIFEKLHFSFCNAAESSIKTGVKLCDETIWLSISQMAKLFHSSEASIHHQIKKIFKNKELSEKNVTTTFSPTGCSHKKSEPTYYNLDVIITVGYRTHSKHAELFRKWSSNVLKKDVLKELSTCTQVIERPSTPDEIDPVVMQTINDYAKTWALLSAYDENKLHIPKPIKGTKGKVFTEDFAMTAISHLKNKLFKQQPLAKLFGIPNKEGISSIINNLEQTFDNISLYKSAEEKAAHLLYFIIKDHPFVDGNKRIGCFVFLLYIQQQNLPTRINDNGLITLALLVAESAPRQKELIIKLIINIIAD